MKSARILVTGLIRSGTTWTGRMLATARRAVYLHEPFNPDSHWNAAVPTPQGHLHLHADNGGPYRDLVERLLRFEPMFRHPWASQAQQNCEAVITTALENWGDRADLIPVVKDPTAVLSAEWLVAEFGLTPVLVVRHPVLVTKSLLRAGWGGDAFMAFRKQPQLAELLPEHEVVRLTTTQGTLTNRVERTASFIRLLTTVVSGYQSRHPDWHVVDHDTFSREPQQFSVLLDDLGLEPSDRTEAALSQTGRYNPEETHQSSLHPIPPDELSPLASDEFCSDWAGIHERWFADVWDSA